MGFENGKIGSGTTLFKGNRLGIIGVYDRTNNSQLNNMINDSREATRCDCHDFDEG